MIGADDLSHRFLNLLLLIKNKKEIPVLSLDKQASFLHSRDAARFLSWVIDKQITGTINAAGDAESAQSLVEKVGGDVSRIGLSSTHELDLFKGDGLTLDTTRAQALGYVFERNQDWIPEVSGLWKYHMSRIISDT
jgi:nucleoside-diphosphate-sugar epimerase